MSNSKLDEFLLNATLVSIKNTPIAFRAFFGQSFLNFFLWQNFFLPQNWHKPCGLINLLKRRRF